MIRRRTAAPIPLDRLTADPDQPRKTFTDEEIDRLADSLRNRGMLQPNRARPLGSGPRPMGHRRRRAPTPCGPPRGLVGGAVRDGGRPADGLRVPDGPERLSLAWGGAEENGDWLTARPPGPRKQPTRSRGRVPVPVFRGSAIGKALRFIENGLQEDLPPLEQASAFRALMEANGWSARRLAEERHISHQTVIRSVGLLELPAEVKERVEAGELSPRSAAEIATLERPEDQRVVADLAVAGSLNRDQVADVVKARKSGRGDVSPSLGRSEIRLDGRRKVIVAGLSDDRPETILAALRQATKQVQGRLREASRSEEEAA